MMIRNCILAAALAAATRTTSAFQPHTRLSLSKPRSSSNTSSSLQAQSTRRQIIDTTLVTAASLIATTINPLEANAAAAVQDSLGIDNFLRTGVDGKFYIVFSEIIVHIICSYHIMLIPYAHLIS